MNSYLQLQLARDRARELQERSNAARRISSATAEWRGAAASDATPPDTRWRVLVPRRRRRPLGAADGCAISARPAGPGPAR